MAYSTKPVSISSGDTLIEWRNELNKAIERLNELFNSSDEFEPKTGAIFNSSVINNPSITNGSITGTTITNATINGATISNPTVVSGGTFSGGSVINNAVINDATFNNLGTAAFADIGNGVTDVALYTDLEAATDEGVPTSDGAYLGQMFYDSDNSDWYIWNGTSWDQISIVP